MAAVSINSAVKVTPGGAVTRFIDATGDGVGNPLSLPAGIAVDESGAVYLGGRNSDNVFKIPAALTPVELLTFSGE